MASRPMSRLAVEVLISSAVAVAEVKRGARRGFLTLDTVRKAASEKEVSRAEQEMLSIDEN